MAYLSEEAREAKRAYMKKWRDENKDKVRATQERYWKKKLEQMRKENKSA